MIRFWRISIGLCLYLSHVLVVAQSFVISDIEVTGLQRISPGTVFNYLPIKSGDNFDVPQGQAAIRALYKTGLFHDVSLARRENVLIFDVRERPTISKISYEGNKELDSKELGESLKSVGFATGRVFKKALLEQVEQELQRLYFSQGRYSARIETTVSPQVRNRVHIHFKIVEGRVAKIKQINIIGNKAFSDKKLLKQFELGIKPWYLPFSSRDQYVKSKLRGDLEKLRAYYLDRGYLNFSIDSPQVEISPDKSAMYITVNISEGDKYQFSDVKIEGNLILTEAELQKKIEIKPGEIFSRKQVVATTEALIERLGDEGYIFANVNAIPDIDETEKQVKLTFFLDPGRKVYVNRINFAGNQKTRDEVLRRELRQMEAGWASTQKISRSRTRLQRLNFFESVSVETPATPGTDDQINVNYTVVERPSGNLMAGLGYSQTQGVLFNFNVTQDNFLGSGKRVGIEFSNSDVNRVYSLTYNDPYFTIDGISQGFSIYYRETDAGEANLSRYALDVMGANLNFGLPINEYDSINFGIEPQKTTLKTTSYSAQEVSDYIANNGDSYQSLKLTGRWAHDTRNRVLFPTKGVLQSFGAEISLPVGDLQYYKLNYRQSWYLPVWRDYTFSIRTNLGYANSYGDSKDFPFFEHYTAGGPSSVRGFKENTLGPHDSLGNPWGGKLKVVGNLEFFFPPPFLSENKSLRMSAFLDAGNVYDHQRNFDAGELRYSTGIALGWFSPLGALNFSIAKPLNDKEGDDTQVFQFSLGASF